MKLLSITIENYRSIEKATFNVAEIAETHTFTLIGINESGKSSFLTAISLVDGKEKVTFPKDFFDDKQPVRIALAYQLDSSEDKELKKALSEKGFDKDILSQIEVEKINVCATFEPTQEATKNVFDEITFKKKTFTNYTSSEAKPVKKDPQQTQEDFDVEKYFETNLPKYFYQISHHITFWKSDSKHLINEQINLDIFAADPENVSIPLMNCFALAGISNEDIPAEVTKLKTDPAEINNLQEKLGDKVTAHIKDVWPNHPVKIKFQINNSMLSFLVEDDKVKYKSKTTEQRSDGFRQFISFLLTISAENANEQLSNSLLLLDEPETHLHPQAQELLKAELIKITKNRENNIVFFATHSNYMIDKDHMDRCYRVVKQKNSKTELERIKEATSSYSEVNYEVFDIPSNDYHNELYGYLADVEKAKLDGLPETKDWINEKTNKTEKVSLATYIRHSIHHPENTSNLKFTPNELSESIEKLRELKYKKQK
ncbi:MAG: AAA family ATPase [Candidatus Azambacteria bacterium]|nr:AAA family ATPase [Candidatus Azambacteria bacterium]